MNCLNQHYIDSSKPIPIPGDVIDMENITFHPLPRYVCNENNRDLRNVFTVAIEERNVSAI